MTDPGELPHPIEIRRALTILGDAYEALWRRSQAPPPAGDGPEMRRLLSYRQLAEYLGVGVGTAKQLAAAGELRKVQVGARVLFDREDVDRYVERIKRAG